jgi:hypothetical protein
VPSIKNVNPSAMALVIVLMMNMRMAIRATLGFERGLYLNHLGAQSNDHRAQHMVGQQPQAGLANLQRNMSITDVIGNPGKLLGISGPHFKERLKLGLNRDDPTIVELKSGSVAQ